ncbi:GIY-YIG nuclease family protein [Brevibacillus sp. SYSU BS000544]|uniref:GIY-YIG nuclease family protein n=1 Tax=Brevibacillus sp. SYSU BS000544 TaxID=3416443 RepID=UPI003CE56536
MNCTKYTTANGMPSHDSHFVYILRCTDGTLYTGYTTNVARRLQQHNEGKAAKYTRGRVPAEVVYVEEGETRSWGLRREEAIKKLARVKKEMLICSGVERRDDNE